jgi:hypothetical protein
MKKILIFLILCFGVARADTWQDTIHNDTDDGSIYTNWDSAGAFLTGFNTYYFSTQGGLRDTVVLRFETCPIPSGATISVCSLGFYTNANDAGICSTLVRCEYTASATTFSSHADFENRIMTTAVDSMEVPAGVSGSRYWLVVNPDVLQEVIDRGDWSANNDVAFFMCAPVDLGANRKAYDYYLSSTLCAEVRVTYSTGETVAEILKYKHGPGGARTRHDTPKHSP